MREELRRVGFEGLIAGLIGYAAIVVFFGAFNLIEGRSPFFTAALLGSVLTGRELPTVAGIDAGSVLAWNGLHMIVFVVLGVISARIAVAVEHSPRTFWGAFLLGVFGFILATAMMYAFAEGLGQVVPFWAIAVAMLVATGGMLAYLLRSHPRLRWELRHLDEIDEADARGLTHL